MQIRRWKIYRKGNDKFTVRREGNEDEDKSVDSRGRGEITREENKKKTRRIALVAAIEKHGSRRPSNFPFFLDW